MTTMKIKKITTKKHNKPIPVYCLSVPPFHRVEVVGKHGKYISGQSINFGAVFGAQASTLMTQSIKPNWKPEHLDRYIKANKLEIQVQHNYTLLITGELRFIYLSLDKQENLLNAKYYTIAEDVREKFFNAYSGIEKWIETTREFAKKTGYVVSIYGAIRRLPYLLTIPNKNNRKEINMGYYSNLLNICLNSPIQNMESIVMNRSFIEIGKLIKENEREERLFGQIHDAIELTALIENDDWKYFALKVHEIAEKGYPEYDGIPLEVESNFSDYYGKGELWDMGRKFTSKTLKEGI